MSNYPAGAEFDSNAPYNQEDAKPVNYIVTFNVTIDANDRDHALELAEIIIGSSISLNGFDYEISGVQEE